MISLLNMGAKLNKFLIALLLIIVVSGNYSCKKVIDIESSRLSDETTQWTKLEDAKAGLIGIYALMRTAMVADNTHWLIGDLRQGDFASTSRPDLKSIVDGQLNASYPLLTRVTNWRRFYSVVNAASLFIERSGEILPLDKRYTTVNHDVDIAQARALRAFAYFYMTRIWGDVPLLTSSHDGDFEQHARTSQAKVLAFATSELLLAAKVLPFRYGGTDAQLPGLYYGAPWPTWNGVLFTKLAAYAILAHISAWQSNYFDTEVYTKFIVDNYTKLNGDGSFGIRYIDMDALTENNNGYSPFAFKRATQVVGFGFEYGNGEATANGHLEQLTLASPLISKATPEIYVPKDTIRKVFTDPGDLRFSIDPLTKLYRTNYFLNYSTEKPMFSKIKVVADARTSGDFALFTSAVLFTRLEELTLLRAEALAVLGQRNEAIDNLNRATNLRGIIPYGSTSSKDLIDAIFEERRRELMGEGWRWFDQVRYNKIKRNNAAFNTLIDRNGIYWPVSKDVINANPSVTQNGYWN
ncbi:RagB/SusD family nutrient uptake outer membrane protein [Pedobacter punctiformis]|uniref:RagB/SusD family nutrient uptake outer membrane protein n=1 Tax=Pedobacter punctiformis TaxID=3004097 RepID=A0ABT4LAH3_9SPHI|nr:RagB/SusD family nutrient uptake outer membrane protein [Pedobacter sp. HCMS5-2]MCZ4244856.1 RagB/SusD family nutrient uptake outer membrane protein [Pedobacter sp. HCMS5-2]